MVIVLVLHPRQIWVRSSRLRLEPRSIILLTELLDKSVVSARRDDITLQHSVGLLRMLLDLGLFLDEVSLMVVLSLEGPRHL